MKNSQKTLSSALRIIILSILIYGGAAHTQNLNPGHWPNLKGYWQFDDTSNLVKATVGNDLILVGAHQWVKGAFYGDTAIRIDTGSYYICKHGIAPNGGGDSVNRYTLMFDFKVLNLDRWHCFFQTDTTNTNDGECFIKHYGDSIPGTIGVGFNGYSSDSIQAQTWYRLVISVNLGHYYNYYLNGQLLHIGDTDDIQIDGRFALTPKVLFFADNNQEDDTIDIASIAIFDTCLTPAQIAQLGTIDPCIANPPVVDLGDDTILCWNHTLNIGLGTSFKSVLWSTGDTVAAISLDTANFGTGTDTLWVKVRDMNDCEATDTIMVSFFDCSSVGEEMGDGGILLYPNPAAAKIHLILTRRASRLSIMDLSGKIIKNIYGLNKGEHIIDLDTMCAGVYLIRIEGEGYVYRRKLIISDI